MQTLILAGGFGTRLKSVVSDVPKPLAPIGDKCFLDYLILSLKKQGLRDFTFCLHYMADKFVEHYGNGEKLGVNIDYSIEETPAGTGGAISLLRGKINETFCVINADTYLELDLTDMLKKHRETGAFISVAATNVPNVARYGWLELDDCGTVKKFAEKDISIVRSGLINAGLYFVEPQIFSYIRENVFVSLEKEVFPTVFKENKRIMAYCKTSSFFDIGIPEDYYNFKNWIDRL